MQLRWSTFLLNESVHETLFLTLAPADVGHVQGKPSDAPAKKVHETQG